MKKAIPVLIVAILLLSLFLIPLERNVASDGSETITGMFLVSKSVRYPVSVSVIEPSDVEKMGISIDQHELNFGILTKGSKATKHINLSYIDKEVKIRLNIYGDIKDMIEIEKNNFIIDTPENIPIALNATTTGNFSGHVEVVASRPKAGWLGWIMPWI